MSIRFLSPQHYEQFTKLLGKMKYADCYHKSLAFLLTLDTVCSQHIEDLFDINQDSIRPDGLARDWQTGTSRKTTRLAFNLWNGYCYYENKVYKDENGYEQLMLSPYFSVDEIFCCSLAPYYYEAAKLRYPEYTDIF